MEDKIQEMKFILSNGRTVTVQTTIHEFPGSVKITTKVGHEMGNIIICSNEDTYYTEPEGVKIDNAVVSK